MHLAFVLLSEASLPKAEDVARAFGRFAPRGQRARVPAVTPGDPTAMASVELELDPPGTGLVALMPLAVPGGEAEAAARRSISSMGTGWKLPEHQAHLLVTVRDTGSLPAVDSLSRFTTFLAAVSEASGAVGVYWGEAGATHDPAFFRSVAAESGTTLRVTLWTGVSVARQDDGRLSLLSLGMKQLELPDLLLIAPGSDQGAALATFFDLLAYLVDRGQALPEGDTVGRAADERLPVRYVPSPIDPGKQVWRVELP